MRSVTFAILWALATTSPHAHRYALVIGQNNGGPKTDSLLYAQEDAIKFSGLLRDLAGFPSENTVTLIAPDSSSVEESLEDLANRIRKEKAEKAEDNILFLLYYSGHADGRRLNLGSGGYSLSRLQSKIRDFPSRIKVAVFDACQSGALTRFKGGKLAEPFYLRSQQQIQGQVIIASSAANERAQESDELKGSIFSHHWINGLRGSADMSGDKKITLSEAYQYAYGKTVETTALTGGGVQHPSYQFKIFGQGEIVLTDLSDNSSGVAFGPGFSGRHLILSENYASVVADFYKPNQQEQFIALDPGRYTIINRRGRNAALHHFTLNPRQTYRVAPDSFYVNPLAWNTSKGAEGPGVSDFAVKKKRELEANPLSTYSGGFSLGSLNPQSEALQSVPLNQFQLGFTSALYMNKRVDLTIDAEWLFPRQRVALLMGTQYYLRTSRFRPFLGFGGGFETGITSAALDRSLGIAAVAKAGFLWDTSDFLQVGLQIPYRWVFSRDGGRSVGVDLLFLFSNPLKRVKKINPDP